MSATATPPFPCEGRPSPALIETLNRISAELRHEIIVISHRAQSAHLGGSLSCVDLLVALYWTQLKIDPARPLDSSRDRFVFSKGHAVSALYAVLAKRGFFPEQELLSFNQAGSRLPEQPSPSCVPGIEWATGSLGHGLGVGLGMAVAAQLSSCEANVYVLMGDGECQEGTIWEAAMLAPRLRLGRLVALIDFNRWQATARSNDVMAMEPLRQKWEAFGWTAREVNGHDISEVIDALTQARSPDTPLAVIAKTVKGKGVSFIEDDNNWHYRSPTEDELGRARKELGV